MIRRVVTGLLIVATAGAVRGAVSGEKGIPDASLGLSRTSVFEVPSPPPVEMNDSEPGERPVFPRVYEGSPPLIPHAIGDFLPITRDDNQCIDCHQVDEKEEGEPTPIPASHFVDFRNAPDTRRDAVAGARYVCVSCHVPQTLNPPLVENGFTP
jgi:cytochrome c-type protein NapB